MLDRGMLVPSANIQTSAPYIHWMCGSMGLTLILGNQLHEEWLHSSCLGLDQTSHVLMIEDIGLASAFRYHKLRLLHTFVAMRSFRDQLINKGFKVQYFELSSSKTSSFWERLEQEIKALSLHCSLPELRVAEIPDMRFQRQLEIFCQDHSVDLTVLPSPAFLSSAHEISKQFQGRKRPLMKSFYERQRKRLNILIEGDGSPTGGAWSFDKENRRRLPKGYREPPLLSLDQSPHEPEVRRMIDDHFPNHPGELSNLYIPYDHAGAQAWLSHFLHTRLEDFGPYEDALSQDYDILQHSLLSPLMNIGLLSPASVVEQTLNHAENHPPPIASLEGFLRQVIGWREFVRGIDLVFGQRQATSNFWDHQRGLHPCWNDGTTKMPPLDRAIKKLNRFAYNHHIERLMVISNLMLLCEIHPHEVYRWFMERYLDSYEWVMGPNIYGMGQMSDGGIFATKPYICGSNYILKMGGGPKGPWCEVLDGLYWRFIDRHRSFFCSNPRLSMMISLLERIDNNKRLRLFTLAEAFVERVTIAPR